MSASASVVGYFWQAGLVVKSVMFLLLMASVGSWTLMLQRAWFFKQKNREYQSFVRRFWECSDLNKLFQEIDTRVDERVGLAAIFHAGFKEFSRIRKLGKIVIEPIARVMMIAHIKETEALERHLSVFASIGSIAPYVGLFGTVWGIMSSFQALGQAQQATIAMVAPGISEALVATALGLFTAIPAVIAFNRCSTRANGLIARYDLFQEELMALIEQQTQTEQRGRDYA